MSEEVVLKLNQWCGTPDIKLHVRKNAITVMYAWYGEYRYYSRYDWFTIEDWDKSPNESDYRRIAKALLAIRRAARW